MKNQKNLKRHREETVTSEYRDSGDCGSCNHSRDCPMKAEILQTKKRETPFPGLLLLLSSDLTVSPTDPTPVSSQRWEAGKCRLQEVCSFMRQSMAGGRQTKTDIY